MMPTGVIRTYVQTNKWRLQASFGANGLKAVFPNIASSEIWIRTLSNRISGAEADSEAQSSATCH